MNRLNSDPADSPSSKISFRDVIAVGVIQFCLSLLTLCYGIYLMQFILQNSYNLKTILWTAVLHVAMFKMTRPCVQSYSKHLDNDRRKNVHKRGIIAATFVLCGNLAFLSFYTTSSCLIIFYGVLGGICSSFIYGLTESASSEAFRRYPKLFQLIDNVVKSFCLLLMPHLVLIFTKIYDTSSSFLILSGALLNIIPASLLLKNKKQKMARLCKFQTVDQLSIEMADFPKKVTVEYASSSEDEEYELAKVEEHDEIKEEPQAQEASTQSFTDHLTTHILPNIPEESEEEDEEDINEISAKRLSRISAILQDMQDKTPKNLNLSVNNLFQLDEAESVQSRSEHFVEMPRRCIDCNCGNKVCDFFQKHYVRKMFRILRTVHFYPMCVSSSITTFFSTVVLATTPYLMFQTHENANSNNIATPEESTFLLTIFGFTWLFFLAGYPIFNKLSDTKLRFLFLTGVAVLALSLFIVHEFSYNNFVHFSLTFGFGHGIVSYSEPLVDEIFCGKFNWRMLEGALEVAIGSIVILVYLVIYFVGVDIYAVLSNAYWVYAFDVVLWIFAYLIQRLSRCHCQTYGSYDLERINGF